MPGTSSSMRVARRRRRSAYRGWSPGSARWRKTAPCSPGSMRAMFKHLAAALAMLVATAAVAQPRTAPEPARTYRIGFAQLVDHPALNATRQGFIDGLKASGFEQGKNLVFDYQNAQGDPGTSRNIIEKFLADKVDLVAPCTTP